MRRTIQTLGTIGGILFIGCAVYIAVEFLCIGISNYVQMGQLRQQEEMANQKTIDQAEFANCVVGGTYFSGEQIPGGTGVLWCFNQFSNNGNSWSAATTTQ